MKCYIFFHSFIMTTSTRHFLVKSIFKSRTINQCWNTTAKFQHYLTGGAMLIDRAKKALDVVFHDHQADEPLGVLSVVLHHVVTLTICRYNIKYLSREIQPIE